MVGTEEVEEGVLMGGKDGGDGKRLCVCVWCDGYKYSACQARKGGK